MNQKLSDWASVAEIVSGIAVVVTLVFLVVGLNANTNATHAVVYKDLLGGINDFNRELINDSELAQLWSNRATTGLDSLASEDAERLVYMNRIIFRIFDSAYFAFETGSLDARQRQRFHDLGCSNYADERYASLWAETVGIVSESYVSYLDDNCTN